MNTKTAPILIIIHLKSILILNFQTSLCDKINFLIFVILIKIVITNSCLLKIKSIKSC